METMESEFMQVKKLAIAMGLLAMGINTSVSAETFNMFEPSASGAPAAGTSGGGTVVGAATYNANINGSIDEDSSLTLSLDALGESVTLDVVSVKTGGSGVTYSATSANMDVLNVAVSDGVMMGSLNYNGNVYKFKPADNGDTLIVEMPEVADSTLPPMASGSTGGETLEGDSADVAKGGTDNGSVIKVIVAYTPEFAAEAGNVSAYMDLMESETNLTFTLSGVNTSVDIVHSYQTSYRDSTNFRKDADKFMNGVGGAGQDLRTQRNSRQADIMVVMTGNMGYDSCGYSAGFNVQGHEENPNGHNALAIVREGCGTGYYGFAHQLGFIFGADLNDGNSNMVGGGDAYAHGYCGNGFRTIMSYNCPGSTGGKRFPLWSNPTNDIDSKPTGDATTANNVKVLNDRAKEVSNFRFAVAKPEKPTLIHKDTIRLKAPSFNWTRQNPDHAETYTVKVTDGGGVVHTHTVTPAEAGCENDTACTYTLPAVPEMKPGPGSWMVTAKNGSGVNTSATENTNFIAIVEKPDPVVELNSQSGLITTPTQTFKWTGAGNATDYALYVVAGSSFGWADYVIYNEYSLAEANCSEDLDCEVTVTIPQTKANGDPLVKGDKLRWIIASKNSVGINWNGFKRKEIQLFY